MARHFPVSRSCTREERSPALRPSFHGSLLVCLACAQYAFVCPRGFPPYHAARCIVKYPCAAPTLLRPEYNSRKYKGLDLVQEGLHAYSASPTSAARCGVC